MGTHGTVMRPLVRKPRGGYRMITVRQICVVWSAYRAGIISLLGLRVYLALHEVAERRHAARARPDASTPHTSRVKLPRALVAELQRLVRCARASQVRKALHQLAEVGLVAETAGSFVLTSSDAQVPADLQVRVREMEARLGRRGRVPFPRKALRRLAAGGPAAITAAMLGTAIRCLYLHDRVSCSADGSCSAQLLADAFGLHPRTVKIARRRLRFDGWITTLPADRWHVQRFGARYRVNMAWSPADIQRSPRQAEIGTETPPPIVKHKLLADQETREPGLVATGNSPQPVLRAPRLGHVLTADLTDSGRLGKLFHEALQRGMVKPCQADRLHFVAAAEHALRLGTHNPAGLFVTVVRRGLWSFLTAQDEERARGRLRSLDTPLASSPDTETPNVARLRTMVRDLAIQRSWPDARAATKVRSSDDTRSANSAVRQSSTLTASSRMTSNESNTMARFSNNADSKAVSCGLGPGCRKVSFINPGCHEVSPSGKESSGRAAHDIPPRRLASCS